MNATTRKVCLVLVALGVTVSAAACATGEGAKLDGADRADRLRDGSMAVFLKRKVTDELDVSAGDDVDWKHVDVHTPGILDVGLSFAHPASLRAPVFLRASFGKVIERHTVQEGVNFYRFKPVNAVSGRYYVEIRATTGASVYTLGALFEEPKFVTNPVPDDDPDPPAGNGGRGGRGGGGGGFKSGVDNDGVGLKPGLPDGGGGGAKDPAADPDGQTDPPPVEDSGPKFITVTGAIQRITPLESGGSLLTVYVSGNGSEKIVTGAAGTINGLGARVVVRNRTGTYARAFTKIDAEDLRGYKAVTFKVPE